MQSVLKKYKDLPLQMKASFWFLVCSFMQKGISIISTPIFTRLLSTVEYGQYGVFNSWLSITTVFVALNLYAGMYTRGLVKYNGNKQYSSSLQGLALTLVFCWTLIYLIFHDPINRITSLTTVQSLAMLVMIWSTAAFSFWAAEQRVELHYRILVLITILASVAKPVLGIILVILAEDKVTARILGLMLVEVIVYFWCFLNQMRRGKQFFSRQYWREALILAIPLIPHYLSMSVLNGADKIMIERMIGLSEAGLYTVAYSLSQIMKLFNTALTQTVEPWLYKQIKNRDLSGLGKVAYPTWIMIAGANLLLIAFAPEAVALFAPASYYDAIWVIPPVAMSVFFIFLYSFFAVFEFYFTRTKMVAVATCAGAVLNIVLNYIFIRIFGYVAAGYTTLVCYIIYALMHYLFMIRIARQELGTDRIYDVKMLLGISGAFMLMGFCLLFTYRMPVLRYGIIMICFVLCIVFRKKIREHLEKIIQLKRQK